MADKCFSNLSDADCLLHPMVLIANIKPIENIILVDFILHKI
jgi:hypothetical protein